MIDFGKPLVGGWQCMVTRLFAPFDFAKWLTMGFTVFLAGFLNGSAGNSFNFKSDFTDHRNTVSHEIRDWQRWLAEWQDWSWLAAIIFVIALVLVGVFLWLGARGQFMFLDNVVQNRGEVVVPWKRYRQSGNRLFIFYILVSLLTLLVLAIEAIIIVGLIWTDLQSGRMREWTAYVPAIAVGTFFALTWIPIVLYLFLYLEMGIPIIYHQGCTPLEAAGKLWRLIQVRWADLIVYCLIRLVMGIVFVTAFFIVGFFTCCLGFFLLVLPYVSSVLTLPVSVFRTAFTLECLAQFGPETNVWNRFDPPPLPQTSVL